jgi:hypothetical protein
VRLHGIPKKIISDRGSIFMGRFWTSFQEALGTQLNFSMTYHPKIDGQDKRVNQGVRGYVAYVCNGPIELLGRVFTSCGICI